MNGKGDYIFHTNVHIYVGILAYQPLKHAHIRQTICIINSKCSAKNHNLFWMSRKCYRLCDKQSLMILRKLQEKCKKNACCCSTFCFATKLELNTLNRGVKMLPYSFTGRWTQFWQQGVLQTFQAQFWGAGNKNDHKAATECVTYFKGLNNWALLSAEEDGRKHGNDVMQT